MDSIVLVDQKGPRVSHLVQGPVVRELERIE